MGVSFSRVRSCYTLADAARKGDVRFISDNLATIICGAVIAALLVASFHFTFARASGTTGDLTAVIHAGDSKEYRHPLTESGEFRVEGEGGYNVVRIKDGQVSIAEADCPNGDCTRQRPISHPGEQLVCLPHRVWVEIEGSSPDAGGATTDDVDLVAE